MTPLAYEQPNSDVSFFTLTNALVYRITGRDAARYLNARLSNNIKDLIAGAGCAAAALSPQGRTELFGTVLKLGPEEFLFVVDGGDELLVRSSLARFKVADRVDFTYLPEVTVMHVINRSVLPLEEAHYQLNQDAKEFTPFHNQAITIFPIRRSTLLGYDVVLPRARASELISLLTKDSAHELSRDQQLVSRVLAERPAYPEEINEQAIFLEAGLAHAVSFTKGCYVGQEVLEKVDSHGKLPYSLVSLVSLNPTLLPKGEELSICAKGHPEQVVGQVISIANDPRTGKNYSFARIKSAAISDQSVFTILEQDYQAL